MTATTPFPFENLPKVSRKEQDLLEALQASLPRIGFSDRLKSSIAALVSKELHAPFSLRKERVTLIALKERIESLPKQGVYAVVGLSPNEEKAFLEIDSLVAHLAIDKLLGGEGEPLTMIRALTEIEEGVLSFLILKVLSLIFEKCGKSARTHFRLETLCSAPEALVSFVPTSHRNGQAVVVSFRLSLGGRAGYARLILPLSFVRSGLLEREPMVKGSVPSASQMSDEEFQYYQARLANLGFVQTEVWAELGRSVLKAGEVNRLEAGDVLVLEGSEAHVEAGSLKGSLPLRVGLGIAGGFRAEILPGKSLTLRLGGVELLGGAGGIS